MVLPPYGQTLLISVIKIDQLGSKLLNLRFRGLWIRQKERRPFGLVSFFKVVEICVG